MCNDKIVTRSPSELIRYFFWLTVRHCLKVPMLELLGFLAPYILRSEHVQLDRIANLDSVVVIKSVHHVITLVFLSLVVVVQID